MSRQPSRRASSALIRACAIESLEDRKLMSTVVGLSGRDVLVFFDTNAPDETIAKVKVKGLARRESLVGLDFRPANGQLYALGDSSRLYRIDPTTGQATRADTTGAALDPVLAESDYGFDFNPSVDRLRVVNSTDVNARLDPNTGGYVDFDPATPGNQTDLGLAYAAGDVNASSNPSVTSVAYTNNQPAGTLPTTLFGIDSDTNSLVAIGSVDGITDSPNNGVLTTIGALGLDVTAVSGFDIEDNGTTETAYAALATADRGSSGLYTINLATGAATSVGQIRGSRTPLRGLAVVPEGQTVLVLDARNRLSTFDSILPNIRESNVRVTGLARREKLTSIDLRPASNEVFALSNQNRIYIVNPVTGAATAVGSQGTQTLNTRATYAIDFNPSVDRLRVVNSANDNFRIDPATGQIVDADTATPTVEFDGPLVYASTDVNAGDTPDITGAAYSNNVAASPTTTLYAIDTDEDTLVTVGTVDGTTSPNTGQLFTVGSLGTGIDINGLAQMDIVTDADGANSAFATFRSGRGKVSLHTLDLATGAANVVGQLPRGVKPIGMTVLTGTPA